MQELATESAVGLLVQETGQAKNESPPIGVDGARDEHPERAEHTLNGDVGGRSLGLDPLYSDRTELSEHVAKERNGEVATTHLGQ